MNEFIFIVDSFLHVAGNLSREYREYLVLIYGLIVGLSILWQRHLLVSEDPYRSRSSHLMLPTFLASIIPDKVPRRAVIPYIFGVFIIIGTVVHSSFELNRYNFDTNDWWDNVLRAGLFFFLIVFKAWFGPALIGISIAYSIHLLSNHEKLEWMPIFQQLLDLVFKSLPEPIYIIYTIIILSYMAISSVTDS